jgi:hypothetical protein
MSPEEFFDMKAIHNTGFVIGHGKRGLKGPEELIDPRTKILIWDENIIYLSCLNLICSNRLGWTNHKNDWLANIPTNCPECGQERISHEFIVPNAFLEETIKSSDGISIIQVPITAPFRKACIIRYVRIKNELLSG